jgi:hypothetical protein
MGMRATAIMEEFTGFKTEPRIIGMMSFRSKASGGRVRVVLRLGVHRLDFAITAE